jgi:hypothetical protein
MATRERSLRSEARKSAEWQGHQLGRFTEPVTAMGYTGKTILGAEARCVQCGATVSVIPGFSYEIMGEAVAVGCHRR